MNAARTASTPRDPEPPTVRLVHTALAADVPANTNAVPQGPQWHVRDRAMRVAVALGTCPLFVASVAASLRDVPHHTYSWWVSRLTGRVQ